LKIINIRTNRQLYEVVPKKRCFFLKKKKEIPNVHSLLVIICPFRQYTCNSNLYKMFCPEMEQSFFLITHKKNGLDKKFVWPNVSQKLIYILPDENNEHKEGH
jgi:hypothetical protein